MATQEDYFGAMQQAFLVGWAPVAIFIMATAGFGFLYAGMVRKKNVTHTIIMINPPHQDSIKKGE